MNIYNYFRPLIASLDPELAHKLALKFINYNYIFKDNYLIHSKVIPIGSRLVTKDLAAYLQTSIAEAERVKIEHVSAFSDFADDSKVFEVQIPNDDLKKNVNEKEISKTLSQE